MSERDDLRAEIFDLEDELICLEVDLELAENEDEPESIIKDIKAAIGEVNMDLADARSELVIIERGENV